MHGRNLVYTIAFDPPGFGGTRQLAKLLVCSLMHTYFDGDIIIFKNSPEPIFLSQRPGLKEIYVPQPDVELLFATETRLNLTQIECMARPWMEAGEQMIGKETTTVRTDRTSEDASKDDWKRKSAAVEALSRLAMSWKYRARDYIDANLYDWILYLDADCLVLRNLDHLLPKVHLRDLAQGNHGSTYKRPPDIGLWEESAADILFQNERGRTIRDGAFSAYLGDRLWDAEEAANGLRRADGFTRDMDGINSGTWAVRGTSYTAIMTAWENIEKTQPRIMTQWTEQGAWNRIIVEANAEYARALRSLWHRESGIAMHIASNANLQAEPFPMSEVQFPVAGDMDWRRYKDAAIVHAMGCSTVREKLQLLFGIYMQLFYWDEQMTLHNVLER